jgi:hypothetical protein
MVVAIIALVVAASGTAVAATALVHGDRLIEKHSLSGNRLRNHTITGNQVNFKQLGKVLSAQNADHSNNADRANIADRATSAMVAANAANATNAINAANAANATRAASAASADGYFNSGLVTLSASSTPPGNQRTLVTRGPFSFIAQCLDMGGGSFAAEMSVKDNGANGAVAESDEDSNTPTTFNSGDTTGVFEGATGSAAYWISGAANVFTVAAPGGPALDVQGGEGVHVLGADCAFQLLLFG